jgi:hypothetical protein
MSPVLPHQEVTALLVLRRLCGVVGRFGAFLGPGGPQGESLVRPGDLANSVALEPVVLVVLAPLISAISAAVAAAAAAGESRCV